MAIDRILIGNANTYQLTDFRDALSGSLESDVEAYASLCEKSPPAGATWLVEDATNVSPIEIRSTDHQLANGDKVTLINVGGNRAAHGTFTVTVTGADTFTLDGSTGSGAYTRGGQFYRCFPDAAELPFALSGAGQYQLTITGSVGLVAGTVYAFVIYCLGAYRDYYNEVCRVTASVRGN